MLVTAVLLICVIDQLASDISGYVNWGDASWGGQAIRQSPWEQAVRDGLTLKTRDLTLKIDGDTLSAVYAATAPAASPLARLAISDEASDAGDDLVDSVLGGVQVGEFRYGFTGAQYVLSSLTFQRPLISLAGGSETVTVYSDPFRLYRHTQEVLVTRPAGVTVSQRSDQILLDAPSAEAWHPSGAGLTSSDPQKGAETLTPAAAHGIVTFTISEGDSPPGWLDGLRGIGGMAIPVAGGLLNRLMSLLPFAALWWALGRVSRSAPGVILFATARKAAAAVVVALSAVAVFHFAFHLTEALHRPDWATAGPLGLLVGGAAVIWPAACWRIGSADPVRLQGQAPSRWLWRPSPDHAVRLLRLVMPAVPYLVVLAVYIWYVRSYLPPHTAVEIVGVSSFSTAATAFAAVTTAAVLTSLTLGAWNWRTGIVSAAFSAVLLAATAAWPLLWYNTFSPHQVNPAGKWIFLCVALLVAAGLCVMSARIALGVFEHARLRAASRPTQRDEAGTARPRFPWRAGALAVVVAGILATVVPDVVGQSGVADQHAIGLVPFNLFGWFDALPELLSWLALLLGIVVAEEIVNLPPQLAGVPGKVPGSLQRADPRLAARDLALPVALQLMYWDDTWFYVPVTLIAGIFLVRYLLLPRRLATARLSASDMRSALRDALNGWRTADFAARQRDALTASSADVLRDAIAKDSTRDYNRRLKRLLNAQGSLATTQDDYQRAARAAKQAAFSYRGTLPDLRAARIGLATGAILGIVPVTVTLLTTQPLPGGSGYPILDFLGGTAWSLLVWAGLGWFIGYYLQLTRGGSGTEKGLWTFVALAAASLPASLVWNDAHDWTSVMVTDLQLLVFLVIASVIVTDLRALKDAGLSLSDWPRVHNWRFVATWSTALLTAVATIALTFATTTVTDISQQLTPPPTATGNTGAQQAPAHQSP